MKRICGLISLFVLFTSACNQYDVVLDEQPTTDSFPIILGDGMVASMEQFDDGWRRPQLLNNAKPDLDAQWSNDGSGLFRLQDRKSGAWIEVIPKITRDVDATLANGHVVHRGAGPDGGDVFFRIHPERVEDFVEIKDDSTPAALDYEVTLGDGVAALRQIEDIVEFLDASGTPRFRIPSPYLVDAENKQIPVHIAIDGCLFDNDARPPWQRPIVPAGSRHCTIRAYWNREVVTYPILVDPAWSLTTSMAVARVNHTATLLPSGQVLVVGGGSNVVLAELYDPNTKTWAATGNTTVPHDKHTATVIDKIGKVMIVGGVDAASSTVAETWSPDTGSFKQIMPLAAGRHDHAAVAFRGPFGISVLIAGGFPTTNFADAPLSSVEIWDRVSGKWTKGQDLSNTQGNLAATLLPDGENILMSGGSKAASIFAFGQQIPWRFTLNTAEIYNATTATTSAATNLRDNRAHHSQTLLPNGTVMAIGGSTSQYGYAEIFDPITATWTSTSAMSVGRINHTATLLNSGQILVAGGNVSYVSSSLTSLYEPSINSWQNTSSMIVSRSGHTATRLQSGAVLITGGISEGVAVASCETFLY